MKAFICDRCETTKRGQEHTDFRVEIYQYDIDGPRTDRLIDLCTTCYNDIVNLLKAKPMR